VKKATTEDLLQVAKIRWMCNELENLLIAAYLSSERGRKLKNGRTIMGEITAAHVAMRRTIKKAQKEYDYSVCPPGWCTDGTNCYPCLDE
jgi:hypothetical protein